MPSGEKFLHGNQSLAVVKIGKNSKMFGANKDGDETTQDTAPATKPMDWRRPVKNKVTIKPGVVLKKPGGNQDTRPTTPLPPASVDKTSSRMNTQFPDAVTSSPPCEQTGYAAAVKKGKFNPDQKTGLWLSQ
jgi:hypothetical protein